jgi:hypothetical protein
MKSITDFAAAYPGKLDTGFDLDLPFNFSMSSAGGGVMKVPATKYEGSPVVNLHSPTLNDPSYVNISLGVN